MSTNNKTTVIKCYFCNGNHTCRECPEESAMAPILKKKIGLMMEYWVAENFNCPKCNHYTLNVIGNHTPSLDIICTNCLEKFEVKSKCLSITKLPNDINLPHGSYIDYLHRTAEGLNLIVIIYMVDRIKKNINIRQVLYADNMDLNDSRIIQVKKRPDSNLSNIFIKNKTKLMKFNLKTNTTILSFKNVVDSVDSQVL
jgi:hypothetical protein